MTRVIGKKLGELLVERRVITPEQLSEALAEQQHSGELLGRILVRMGYATEEDIVLALTVQYGFPYLPLSNYELDQKVIGLITPSVARRYRVIPLDRTGNLLTVTMADPLDAAATAALESLTGLRIEAFVSTESQIAEALERYYPAEEGEVQDAPAAAG